MIDNSMYDNERKLPISPVQQGMFFHYIYKKSKIYLEQMICDITGDLDITRMENTINKMIELHDTLRTVFHYKGVDFMQQVVLGEKTIQIDYRDLTMEKDTQSYINKVILSEAEKNFDLSKETFRCKLFRTAHETYVFLCTYHHLIMDAWTIRLFEEEFCKIYAYESENQSTEIEEQYPYELYLNWINEQDKSKAINYWSRYLNRYNSKLCSVIPEVLTIHTRRTMDICFEPSIRKLIDEISNYYKVTINVVILSAWAIYCLEHFQKEELIFGCVVFGRMLRLKNVDKIAGLFVNSIPLYLQRNASLIETVSGLQKDTFLAAEYEYLSLSDIMACGGLKPNDICTYVNFSIDSVNVKNAYSEKLPFHIENIRYEEQANYDVYLDVYLNKGDFHIKIHYDVEQYYFDELLIKNKMIRILESIKENPSSEVGTLLNDLITDEEMGSSVYFDF